jgi:GAF domain-containing protein
MEQQNAEQLAQATLHPGMTGMVVSQLLDDDWTPTPDPSSNAFTEAIDGVLHLTADLARRLIGTHQAAAALVIKGDWTTMRKYFSLSPRYAEWYHYRTPAVGFGIHADVVKQNRPIRLTQAELEHHPDWHAFGREAGKHPPMRGWLAVPLLGRDGNNYGLLQLSDKYDDQDFTEEDEAQLTRLAQLTAKTLDAIHQMHDQ